MNRQWQRVLVSDSAQHRAIIQPKPSAPPAQTQAPTSPTTDPDRSQPASPSRASPPPSRQRPAPDSYTASIHPTPPPPPPPLIVATTSGLPTGPLLSRSPFVHTGIDVIPWQLLISRPVPSNLRTDVVQPCWPVRHAQPGAYARVPFLTLLFYFVLLLLQYHHARIRNHHKAFRRRRFHNLLTSNAQRRQVKLSH